MPDVIIGQQLNPRGGQQPITIKTEARRSHVYLLGQTGTGKSTLTKNMAIQDLENGAGVCVIDPHGDLVEDLLTHVPKHRTNEVVYFNPADTNHPIGLNILETRPGQDKQLVTSSLVSTFRHLFSNSWGPRTEYILHNAVEALIDWPGATLIDIYRILIDASFRQRVVAQVQDPMVSLFWNEIFAKYNDRFRSEVVSPIQNKVGQLLTSSYIRNIVGQPRSTIDLRGILDNQGILLVNLSKGKIGEDRANLLGSVIITQLYLAALERQQIPEADRKDFYLYVDEFESFTTDAFPSILAEARKYRLNLTLSHQYLYQVPEEIQQAIFGNVGSWLVFRLGSSDAFVLEREFSPYIKLEQLRRQANHHIIYKLLIDGVSTIPKATRTFPPMERTGTEADPDTIVRVSRERYGRRRDEVDAKIAVSLGTQGAAPKPAPSKRKRPTR